ncbi:sensor histidine kinase [Roseivirga sp. E12]|uniref:sensor histidine kinase n=1 Tax=Roseivirga sp. E12 TaxID=2819237 RepID=UPI001ABC5778|nr:histidine kinase [Roseivirga sp. E12]
MLFQKVNSHSVRLLLINFTFWLFITLISATQLYVRFQDSYDGGWSNFVWRQSVVWVGWAVLTPFIFYLVKRIKNEHRLRSGLIHFGYAVGFTLVYSVILSVLSQIFFNPETPMLDFIKMNLTTSAAANLLVYLLIAAFSMLIIFYQKAKLGKERQLQLDLEVQSLEKQLLSAHLETLKAQIQPHFLFNSLHSIASLIRKNELTLATETIATLSELLRATLRNQEKNMISLEEEMELIAKYLAVEKIRFGDMLSIQVSIDEDAKNVPIPAFISQPIVENSFKHAFKTTDDASLKISAELSGSQLILLIEDNGSNLSGSWEQVTHAGMGIKNVRQRLSTVYGVSASFSLLESEKGNTIAKFEIPISPAFNE